MHKYCKCLDCEDIFEVELTKEEKDSGKKDNISCPNCESDNIEEELDDGDWECCQGTKDSDSGCHCC